MKRSNVLTLVMILMLALVLAVQLPLAIAARAQDYDWYEPVIALRRLLADEYVEPLSDEQLQAMQEAMLEGMVGVVEDPFTVYVSPDLEAEFTKQLRGRYVGIGAEIDIVDGMLTIVTPMDRSPALEAGIVAGDVVLEIDGVSAAGITAEEAVERLTGEPGSQVTIRVLHPNGEEETVALTRRQIETPTVEGLYRRGEAWEYLLDPESRLAYLRVNQFNRTTLDELRAALASLVERGLEGLILDLRFNPGGELESAVAVADLFLEEGVIVSIRGRNRAADQVFRATAPGTLPDFPLVVLVNAGSASASEIVAGALQENDRAVVLGERTFGKGSVQEIRDLPDDAGSVKLTTAYYFLPGGRNISRREGAEVWGVDPNEGFFVPLPPDAAQEMILARRRYEAIGEATEAPEVAERPWHSPEWIRESLRDPQLAAAVEALRGRVRGGVWPRVGGTGGAPAALASELDAAEALRDRLREQLERAEERLVELRARITGDDAEPPAETAEADGRP